MKRELIAIMYSLCIGGIYAGMPNLSRSHIRFDMGGEFGVEF
mgnify:FL=1